MNNGLPKLNNIEAYDIQNINKSNIENIDLNWLILCVMNYY